MKYIGNKTVLAAILGSLICSTAGAATFNVNKTADTKDGACNSDCSLREAIDAANASLGTDVINLPAGDYKITIAGAGENSNVTGDFDILEDLEINGAGSGTTSISGEGAFKILDVNGVSAPISLSVSDITLKYANLAALDFYGTGNLDVESMVFTKNYNQYGYGAAIEIRSGSTMAVNNSLFTDNCARSAPAIDGEGTWNISNSTFSNHGGWFESPFVAGVDCKIDAYGGGGTMYMQHTDATITNSTFLDNESDGGGAIHGWYGTLNITNSTFSGNTATSTYYSGGALELVMVDAVVKNSTFTNNTSVNNPGGAVAVYSGASLTIENSIIAGNSGVGGADCSGIVTSLGNTLLGDVTGCTYTTGVGDLSGAPGLDVYTDDGTPGNGHYPLLATSQAVDAGNNATCASDDQLGTLRPIGGSCDMGAIEYKPSLTAEDDTYTAGMGITYLPVMSNDTGGVGTVIIKSITAVTPGVGFAGILGDQIAFYRIMPGAASFSYTLEDDDGNTDPATVNVN